MRRTPFYWSEVDWRRGRNDTDFWPYEQLESGFHRDSDSFR